MQNYPVLNYSEFCQMPLIVLILVLAIVVVHSLVVPIVVARLICLANLLGPLIDLLL